MPLPFLPGGLLLALTVLGGAFAAFGVALHVLDKAGSSASGSIAAGLETGLRRWSQDRREPERPGSSPAGEPALAPFRLGRATAGQVIRPGRRRC